jgi:hypothetical protein
MTELDSLERTLALARAELAPSSDDDARVRHGLGLRPPADGGIARNPLRPWQALRASGLSGVLVGVLLMVASGSVGHWLGRTAPRDGLDTLTSSALVHRDPAAAAVAGTTSGPPRAAAPLPLAPNAPAAGASQPNSTAPNASGPSPSTSTQAIEEAARPASPASEGSVPARAKRSRTSPSLAARPPAKRGAVAGDPAEELALLRRVEKSLRANDPALALALLDELDERFPRTSLGEERLAARVIAHCAVGDGGARLRAESFLSERPGSVYAERVQTACTVSAGARGSSGVPAPSEGSRRRGDE